MGYNFGTSYSTKEWDAARGSTDLDAVMFGLEDDALLPEFGCGTDGVNTFTLHINTSSTVEGSSYTRDSAWRKAYRFLNRFDPGTINMDRVLKEQKDTQGVYKVSRSFARTTDQFELPIDHKPPCRFPLNENSNRAGSRPNIEMIFSTRLILGAAGDVSGENELVEWSIGSTGLRLIENSNPESIEFSLLKTGTIAQKIDTSTSIVPAYSGEILSFQDSVGYMGNVQGGGVKIFIDITQTDEVLRWDPDTIIKPEDHWLNSFSSIQLRNDSRTSPKIIFKKSTLEVVSNDKDNYVVSFHSDAVIPMTKWLNDDIIRTEFKRKKTIVFGDNRAPWEGAVYENIRYRSLADEFQDDPWVQGDIEPPVPTGACCVAPGDCRIITQAQCTDLGSSNWIAGASVCDNCDSPDDGGSEAGDIQPFTVSLNGTLDNGTITINYPSGVNATGITFEVYIEKDPDLPLD